MSRKAPNPLPPLTRFRPMPPVSPPKPEPSVRPPAQVVYIGKPNEVRIADGSAWKKMIIVDDMMEADLGTRLARAICSIDEILNLHPPHCQGWLEMTRENILAVDFCASCEDRVMVWWRSLV